GSYRGHLYGDAHAALQRWHRQGIPLYVYSSGSIQAQKLLFRHSDHGDLTPWFSGHFDTTTGPKTEAAAYGKIIAAIGLPAAQVLFLSDSSAELAAAQTSGLQVCWLTRPEDCPASPDQRRQAPYPSAASFTEIQLDPA
ncbi:MAG: acireductone synthase, partial [Synechococcales cyanobacterium CRU_2_2]|nr:acireductone synthase [Synechococcales cyanobacterium CRU_2_2]